MKVLTLTKQPVEKIDWDIDYKEWVLPDTFKNTIEVSVNNPALRVYVSWVTIERLKVWIMGGIDGETYTVQITLRTVAGRVRQDEIIVKIKEIE